MTNISATAIAIFTNATSIVLLGLAVWLFRRQMREVNVRLRILTIRMDAADYRLEAERKNVTILAETLDGIKKEET